MNDIEKIINAANELESTGQTGASTSEQIAAAFVLNNQNYLPGNYSVIIEAWERLGDWQFHVKCIRSKHMHLIKRNW
jgi:hypothetical protein